MKNDLDLKRDVLEELKSEPTVNAAEIGIMVKEGIVTLTGFVDKLPEKWGAERAAKRIFGVKAVANEIRVRLPAFEQRNDADIARAVLQALEWDTLVPHENIKMRVQEGCVSLEGEVKYYFQKEAAEHIVHRLTGVKEVHNQIIIQPGKVNQGKIRKGIELAFVRNAALDAGRITIETFEGKVILRGFVRSLNEREEAERVARSSPGVSEVENYITIVS